MHEAPKCGMCKKPLDAAGNCADCDDRQKEKLLLNEPRKEKLLSGEPPEFKSRDENT